MRFLPAAGSLELDTYMVHHAMKDWRPVQGASMSQYVVCFSQMYDCRGIPVDVYTRQQVMIAYWGMGKYWGNANLQNAKAHLIGHIKVLAKQFILTFMMGVSASMACDDERVKGCSCSGAVVSCLHISVATIMGGVKKAVLVFMILLKSSDQVVVTGHQRGHKQPFDPGVYNKHCPALPQ